MLVPRYLHAGRYGSRRFRRYHYLDNLFDLHRHLYLNLNDLFDLDYLLDFHRHFDNLFNLHLYRIDDFLLDYPFDRDLHRPDDFLLDNRFHRHFHFDYLFNFNRHFDNLLDRNFYLNRFHDGGGSA